MVNALTNALTNALVCHKTFKNREKMRFGVKYGRFLTGMGLAIVKADGD